MTDKGTSVLEGVQEGPAAASGLQLGDRRSGDGVQERIGTPWGLNAAGPQCEESGGNNRTTSGNRNTETMQQSTCRARNN